jgi:3-oxoacyl-[acyl-carrier protein] reductase
MTDHRIKNVIVTGGSRGLGLSHVQYLASRGYNVAIIDISQAACRVYHEIDNVDSLLDTIRKHDVKAEFYECDLTDREQLDKTLETIKSDFSEIHAVVANVGGDVSGKDKSASGGKAASNSIDISLENHNEIFDRNYLTCLNTVKAVLPYFKSQGFGKIVTTTSISAGYGVRQETAYAVSKSAVLHLTRCVATEMRAYDINVNCIAPGATLTGRFQATIKDRSAVDKEKILACDASFLNKPAEPKYISSVVEFLLSPASDYISGQVIRIDGGQFTSPI